MSQGPRSLAALTGVVFVVFFVVSFVIVGESPGADDPVQEVVSFYAENDTQVTIASLAVAIAAVFFLFFTGVLRSVLRSVEGGTGWLSAVAFAGGVVAAVGMLLFAGLGFVLGDSADDLSPEAVQAINVLSSNLFFPLAGGIVTLLFATGLSALQTNVLPTWLAWAALVLAVAGFTPIGFFAFLAAVLWVLVVSILLIRGTTSAAPAPGGTPVP
jgi:hypothetical protein